MVKLVKCPKCWGYGEKCASGCSAHDSNWHTCPKCNGTGKVEEKK